MKARHSRLPQSCIKNDKENAIIISCYGKLFVVGNRTHIAEAINLGNGNYVGGKYVKVEIILVYQIQATSDFFPSYSILAHVC